MRSSTPSKIHGIVLVGVIAHTGLAADATVDFNRDVRPILAQHCFPCHGPDEGKRRGGLRLDLEQSAGMELKSGHRAIVQKDVSASELVKRIRAADADERMPPAEAKKPLAESDIATLVRWIEAGGRYDEHWAFKELPAEVPIPEVANSNGSENPIDRFVVAHLQHEGMKPSPEASRETLLRRVSLDLDGIPPTPEEVAAFRGDASENAYEKVVDRLLASPRFGEKLAQGWLDVARYADSYGYQSDQLSSFWPWRDFVVRSFNENLPYDQFLTWQLAGDLLPSPTRDQRLATAFSRLHRMTNEGGTIHEEFRVEGVVDRVNTFGTAFLGLTIECARCHDHKFDPITTQDYYGLFAQFQNIEEEGTYLDSGIIPTPSLLLPTPEQEAQRNAAMAKVATARAALDEAMRSSRPTLSDWIQSRPGDAKIEDRGCVARVDFESIDNGVAASSPATLAGMNLGGSKVVDGADAFRGKALLLNGEDGASFDPSKLAPEIGEVFVPFTLGFELKIPASLGDSSRVIVCRSGGTDVGYHGFDLMLDDGAVAARIYRHWPGNAIAVKTKARLPRDRFVHLACSFDGMGSAAGFAIYFDGERMPVDVIHDKAWKTTEPGNGWSGGVAFGARFRDRGLAGAVIDDVVAYDRALAPIEVKNLVDPTAIEKALHAPLQDAMELRGYFTAVVSEPIRTAAANVRSALKEQVAIENGIQEIAVMEESATKPAFVLSRGRYDQKDAARPVAAAAPAHLGLPSALEPKNRLGLAKWLCAPNHPLTARVAVNRLWAQCFGKGLVPTLENFGMQGEMPAHPELLDWLARDFVRHGYDVKHVLKTIVMSRTYRQSSARSPNDRDPENRLFARGPSKRLPGEALRDSALYAAGLLHERLGGPPVSPYQPANFWTESNSMSPGYSESVAPDVWRRSLYTVWKRTSPMPNMTLFDAPSREVCVARRSSTNTPLQALVLLNDVQFVEACRVLAEKAMKASDATPARIADCFVRLCARAPDADELATLEDLVARQYEFFAADLPAAKSFLSIGKAARDESLDPALHAAFTAAAQAIMNSDLFITER